MLCQMFRWAFFMTRLSQCSGATNAWLCQQNAVQPLKPGGYPRLPRPRIDPDLSRAIISLSPTGVDPELDRSANNRHDTKLQPKIWSMQRDRCWGLVSALSCRDFMKTVIGRNRVCQRNTATVEMVIYLRPLVSDRYKVTQ